MFEPAGSEHDEQAKRRRDSMPHAGSAKGFTRDVISDCHLIPRRSAESIGHSARYRGWSACAGMAPLMAPARCRTVIMMLVANNTIADTPNGPDQAIRFHDSAHSQNPIGTSSARISRLALRR